MIPDRLSAPGWVSTEANPIKGLDLLGLRLSGQNIGNSLLDGVTTITPSVRYLSLRCWLANAYIQARRPDEWRSFRAFADRVEAAIAFGNLLINPQAVGVIGHDRARERLKAKPRSLALEQLVKQPAVNIYGSPSEDLGLAFSADSGLPGLTRERGIPLAATVAAHLSRSKLGRQLGAGQDVKSASVADLTEFGELAQVDNIPDKERRLLAEVLVPPEPRKGEWPRFSTYALLLHLAGRLKRLPNDEDLFLAASRPRGSDYPAELGNIVDGWLRYGVRDLLAVAHEMVVAAVIDELAAATNEGKAAAKPASILRSLLGREREHNEALRSFGLLRRGERYRGLSLAQLKTRVQGQMSKKRTEEAGLRRWAGELQDFNLIKRLLSAGAESLVLLPVAWFIAVDRTEVGIDMGIGGFDALDVGGWGRIGVNTVIRPAIESLIQRDASLPQAMAELALRSVEQHLRIAWTRLAQDPRRDVAVLLEDEGYWRYKARLEAGRTASRLTQAVSWLWQLELVDEAGLSPAGHEVLDRALAGLRSRGAE
jgi:hypothetical protein